MPDAPHDPIEVAIVAVPETAGSALYGMVDVLSAAGSIWETLVGDDAQRRLFRVTIVSTTRRPFACGHDIPVRPGASVADDPPARIVILPELWLGPDEPMRGRYPALMDWIRASHARGAAIYSACSGAVMLAETGLLDGCEATSHWGYEDLFRTHYPKVRFRPEPNLAFADPGGSIVTAGGTTSWHDLAIHIIARHASPGEALRIAKVYLLKWHGEGQLPYQALVRAAPHADSAVSAAERHLAAHYAKDGALAGAVAASGLPERTLKRRFKRATGLTLIEQLQNHRIEAAKRALERTETPIDEIAWTAGYEDASFFRRLFKRRTGLTPGQYRRMFQPIAAAAGE